jgi:hypothetical protein
MARHGSRQWGVADIRETTMTFPLRALLAQDAMATDEMAPATK